MSPTFTSSPARLSDFSDRLSDEELLGLLRALPQDTRLSMARNAAHQHNLRLLKLTQGMRILALPPEEDDLPWSDYRNLFTGYGDDEIDQLACILMPQRNNNGERIDLVNEEPQFSPELREHVRQTVADFMGSNARYHRGENLFVADTTQTLLAMTIAMNDIDSTRSLLQFGPLFVRDYRLRPAIVNSNQTDLHGHRLLVSPFLLAALHASPEMLAMLRGHDFKQGSGNPFYCEPLLECAWCDNEHLSIFDLIEKDVVSIGPARMAMLLQGVAPEYKDRVSQGTASWLPTVRFSGHLDQCVESDIYKLAPDEFAIRLSQSALFTRVGKIADEVDWFKEDDKTGLNIAQRCIWESLCLLEENNHLVEMLALRLDMPALLLKPDAKGSTLFDQIAKSGNQTVLAQALKQLSSLNIEDASAVIESATKHARLRTGLGTEQKALTQGRLQAWLAGVHARQALSEIAGMGLAPPQADDFMPIRTASVLL